MIHYKGDNFNEFRDDYFKEENQAGYIWHNKVAEMNNKKLITPIGLFYKNWAGSHCIIRI